MKKFLAAVMAAAMVVSMTSVASFAKPATPAAQATFIVDVSGLAVTATGTVIITVSDDGVAPPSEGNAVATTLSITAPATGADIADALVTSATTGTNVMTITSAGPGKVRFTGTAGTVVATGWGTPTAAVTGTATVTGAVTVGGVTEAVVAQSATELDLVKFAITGPYVEGAGDVVNNVIKPGKTVYYVLDSQGQKFAKEKDYIKMTVSKGESSKNIESVKIVEKKFTTALTSVLGAPAHTADSAHQYYVAVKLRDKMIDSEFKVNFKAKATAKKAIPATVLGSAVKAGETVAEATYGSAWVNNDVQSGNTDPEFMAGTGGVMSKPVKDDTNTVTWTDANRDLAKLAFTADSAVAAYYPKLSTVWDNEFYGMHFATDAYKFEFVGNPTISATARPKLSLLNPFIADDEYTADVADLTVYELVDGALVDATDRFTATTDDDGNQVLVTKTRTLGTYVVTDAEAVMTAAEETVAPEKLVPNTGR